MNIQGFSKNGHWYKGNLHCHSTNSDGKLSPREVADLYKSHGYNFLAISDHDRYSDYRSEFNEENFIILPAIEASAVLYKEKGSNDRIAIHHIHGILSTRAMQEKAAENLFLHLEHYPARIYFGSWNGAAVAQELQDDLQAHGCITAYNHPVWSRVQEADFINLNGISALEIFNYGTVNESGTGLDVLHWDIMLRNGKKVWAFASDDNHNDGIVEDSFGGYIMVKAEKLTHENIIQSIIDGNFYSSSGPDIHDWGIKDNVAYVECSPVNRINFIAGNLINAGNTVMCKNKHDTITRAEFPLKGDEAYIRVECIDMYGNTAWSNPLFLTK